MTATDYAIEGHNVFMNENLQPELPRALSDIDLEGITDAFRNSEGGFYNPAAGTVIFTFGGEPIVVNDEDGDLEKWYEIRPDSRDGYRDMSDFTDVVTDQRLSDRLVRALDGSGAFRRFRNAVYYDIKPITGDEPIGDIWNRFSDARQEARAIEWLVDRRLCDESEAATATRARAKTADRALVEAAEWGTGVRTLRTELPDTDTDTD